MPRVAIIGVPTDFGVDRRGVDMGPSAIRYADLERRLTRAGIEPVDAGDVALPSPATANDWAAIRQTWRSLASVVDRYRSDGSIPLVLGGDHSISVGTAMGLAPRGSLGLLWLDAHGDYNTPATSPSGNVHGMALAVVTGAKGFEPALLPSDVCVRAESTALLGTRDLDDAEAEAIRASPLAVYTMSDIDADGMAAVCARAIERVSRDVDSVLVSLDLDVLDPHEAPGVGTPVRGGITYREAHLAMEVIATELTDRGVLGALELVEVNPIRDHHNETATLAAELAASAFGDRIL